MNKTGQKVFRLRGGIWTIFFIAVLFLARPHGARSLMGLPLIVLGQGIRLWASGCIVKYRGEELQALRLTTWGPYAIVRNPLYIGNGLIGLGWSLIAGWPAVVLFILIFGLMYNYFIVPSEEAFLENKFGERYINYRNRTGRFLPKGLPGKNIYGPFDSSILWESERHSILVTVLGTILIISRLWW